MLHNWDRNRDLTAMRSAMDRLIYSMVFCVLIGHWIHIGKKCRRKNNKLKQLYILIKNPSLYDKSSDLRYTIVLYF